MKGKLLISAPSIFQDDFFNRAVIYLTEHNDKEGTVGFILNKPMKLRVCDFISNLNCDFTVYKGGPVQQDHLYFIHNIPEMISYGVPIRDNIYWGGDFKKLTQLLDANEISEENIRFFLGYSGWGINQLEEELEENSWTVYDNSYNILETKSWREYILKLDDKLKIWANSPKNPSLN